MEGHVADDAAAIRPDEPLDRAGRKRFASTFLLAPVSVATHHPVT